MTTYTPEQFKKLYGEASLNQFDIKKQSSVGSRVSSSLQQSGTQALEQLTGTGKSAGVSAPTRGFQLAATATGLPVKAAMSALPESVQSGIGKVGETIAKPINWLGDKIGNIQALQNYVTRNPQAAKVIEELAQIGLASAETGGNIAVLQAGVSAAQGAGKGIVSGVKQGTTQATQLAQRGIETTKGALSGVRDLVKPIIAEAKTLPQKARVNVAQAKATEETIKSLPKVGQTAVRSGVELSDVKALYKMSKTQAAQKIVKVVQDFASGKSKVNPFEVVGKPITQGLKMAQTKATSIGQKIGKVADTLPKVTTKQIAPKVINNLKKVNGLEGIKIGKNGMIDFNDTVLATAGTAADRTAIQKIFIDAIKSGTGKSKHLLRQELREILGGKKAGGIQLTGTQESAFEAIRKGLADTLDDLNPTYKSLSMEYAKAMNPISKLQKLLKTAGVDEDLLNMKAGLLARRLTSFSKSNPEIRQILRDLDNVIATKGKTLLKTEQLQDFYNILDKYYDIAGRTGFQGQTAAGVSKALEGAGLSKTVNMVEGQIGKVFGETEIVKQKALEEILKEILKK
jgi:hypothetical protein